jgi:type VI secretion system secreted protein VgrG
MRSQNVAQRSMRNAFTGEDMLEQAPALLAAFNRFTQDTRLLKLTTPLGTDLLAECVRGEEAISGGFSFRIDALSTDARLPLKSLMGQPALLQLLTATSGQMRAFHGHITAADISGANGGFARYVLTLEPWTRFLSFGRDSRIFQDMTVPDILDVVFRSYAGRGTLVPDWRFALTDRGAYPKRSLTTQYQESDLAFAERLMHEEGMFHYFEHRGSPGVPSLGSHTLVIADHNGAFQPNAQATVAFTRPGAVMRADSIDRWRTESRLSTNAIELGSWDYRTMRQRRASMAAACSDALMPGRTASRRNASRATRSKHWRQPSKCTLLPGRYAALRPAPPSPCRVTRYLMSWTTTTIGRSRSCVRFT